MELSKRLLAVAGLVTEGGSVADIGTDHGYVPIYLVRRGIAEKAIALDINKGPLARAKAHIAACGLAEQIEVRLSDGLLEVRPGEVDVVIAAGMGGGLAIRILEEGKAVVSSLKYCVLQPQSEIGRVRRYLDENGFRIVEEEMVEEGGKFYPMMKAVYAEPGEGYEEYEYQYGKRLLERRHPILREFLLREQRIQEQIRARLARQEDSESARRRMQALEEEIEYTEKALSHFAVPYMETDGRKE